MYVGLSSHEAQRQIDKYGFNELVEHKVSGWAKLIKQLISPISLMLLAAAVLSFFDDKVFDSVFILALLSLNITISTFQENKADKALQKLQETLITTVKVLRNGVWSSISSREIVPMDIIELSIGNVIPADLRLVEAHNVLLNEAAITGESLPQEKKEDDQIYSGTYLARGLLRGEVLATGMFTKFGKTFALAGDKPKRSLLEKDVLTISGFLTKLSLGAVLILSVFLLLQHASLLNLVTLNISLLIAGIPISLPTVMTLIISFGVVSLSEKQVIIRRLSALEDLANVDLLLSDKTGTLTRNEITITQVKAYPPLSDGTLIAYAKLVAGQAQDDVIDRAILAYPADASIEQQVKDVISFIPADSDRKRSTLQVQLADLPNSILTLTLGAPQVVLSLCHVSPEIKRMFVKDLALATKRGDRVLALAIGADGNEERSLQLGGLLFYQIHSMKMLEVQLISCMRTVLLQRF